MPWPFEPSGSPEAPPPQKPRDDKVEGREPAKSWNSLLPKPDPPLQAAKEWAPVFLTAVGSLAAFMFYQSYLRRFAGAASIQENFFRKRSLLGRVTSVGDGDGFHLYHTPGGKLAGWGWFRKIPEGRSNLKGETISIRLAGIDAPEGPHFGNKQDESPMPPAPAPPSVRAMQGQADAEEVKEELRRMTMSLGEHLAFMNQYLSAMPVRNPGFDGGEGARR
ncbi:hypothetical protein BN1723_004276 [Verticillium longisporum]|uniref:Uncharacterized protein n=1 Tax=Verticillium longisporum TaxID=100787 RepID=A0A0G4MSJ7_VERLO|nr:hypothetical protein BN1723_004276 [Verticillium longisporum]